MMSRAQQFTNSEVWHEPTGTLEVVYAPVKGLLHWEELARITKNLDTGLVSRKIIMELGVMKSRQWHGSDTYKRRG